ncbi:nucleotidyltransferase [Pseudomonas poae RE*1-1-14]|uniref:phosphocholine cytidylyltransferase family protein n=1 Tax=Pseudomonas poae TaxID=200451 RepID=UPI0002AF4C8C|nr:sugar phosphate nucleotidyltransferase [Pseudomonas poae]AGE24459.1 nucleotidyltransferase [Pseudomonas poae RE*1-1-14]
MRLVCLMAGSSSRLLPLTTSQHKTCLMLEKRRILDYQLESFERAGIESKTFVLGHGATQVAQILFESLAGTHFTISYNPEFRSRNLDWSAWLALSQNSGPVIYYEGDLLIPPSLLKQVKNSPAEICIAVDSESKNPSIDTLVIAPDGKVKHLLFIEHGTAESQPGDGAIGEFICFVKLGEAARKFVVDALSVLTFKGEMQLYRIFEQAFSRFTTEYVDADGRPWIEVDNPSDLQRASPLAEEILAS